MLQFLNLGSIIKKKYKPKKQTKIKHKLFEIMVQKIEMINKF